MHELLSSNLLFIMPDAIPQLHSDMRSPASGMFLFSRKETDAAPPYELTDGIAVIRVRGVLTQYTGWWTNGYDTIRENVRAALSDPAVSGILLNINSPGGTESGLFELADWLHSVREQKPMHAYADGLMCSAAYCIAAATGSIMAPRMATVGSVGVVWVHSDWSKWNDKAGITFSYLHAGEFKVAGNPDAPLSDRDRTYFQSRLDHSYAAFLEVCGRGMGLDAARAREWADGQIFHGDRAHELGLISTIVRDRDDAIASIRALISNTETDMNLKDLSLEKLKLEHPELHAKLLSEAQGGTAPVEPVAPGKQGTPAMSTTGGTSDPGPAANAPQGAQSEDAALEAACSLLEAGGAGKQAELMRKLRASGLSCSQISAIAPLLASYATGTPDKEQETQGDMHKQLLTALTGAESLKPVGQQAVQKSHTPAQAQSALIDELAGMEV